MAKLCPEKMTTDEFRKMVSQWIPYLDLLQWLQAAVMIVCTFILFGWYRKLRKPMFVWVMWGLFVVSEIIFVAGIVFRYMVQ